eukprot:CFRG1698T1
MYVTKECSDGKKNSLCYVECAKGYQGSRRQYQCLENTDKTLSWKGTPPHCRGDQNNRCEVLRLDPIYKPRDYKCKRRSPNTLCKIDCRHQGIDGNDGEGSVRCVENEDGKLVWEGKYPVCTGDVSKCDPIDYEGVVSNCGNGLEGNKCKVYCPVSKVGSAQDHVCENGKWQGIKPECNSKPKMQLLADVFKRDFLVGASIREPSEELVRGSDTQRLVQDNYNVLVPENYMAWKFISSGVGIYHWEGADKLINYGENNGIPIIGHSLTWKGGGWITSRIRDEDIKDKLMKRMKRHIQDVVGRYKGKVFRWVVVNEWLDNDGEIRQDFTLPRTLGREGIKSAFRWAHEADPDAELYYNGHHLWKSTKAEGLAKLFKEMKDEGVPIDGIGMQGHQYSVEGAVQHPFVGTYVTATVAQFENSIEKFAKAGADVMVTEIDVSVNPEGWSCCRALELDSLPLDFQKGVNPYPDGLPDKISIELAAHYRKFFQMLMRQKDKISAIYFWGLSDDHTWYNFWPIKGRTDYPLLFGKNHEPKLAYYSVIDMVERGDY